MAGVQVGDTSVGDITRGGGGDVVRETDATLFVHDKADKKPMNLRWAGYSRQAGILTTLCIHI